MSQLKKFLLRMFRFSIFFVIFTILITIIGLCLPATPRAAKSLLFSQVQKTKLLEETSSPRIIFIGGSNLSFGLISNIIEQKLKLNPINTAIHAGIGVKFMINSVVPYLREGDIVVLIPEYGHYFNDTEKGSEELLRLIFDVDFRNISFLSLAQFRNILAYLPRYISLKFNPVDYLYKKESDVYSVNSFNAFGDVDAHWAMENQKFEPYEELTSSFNDSVLLMILDFEKKITEKKGTLLVSFPVLEERSFNNQEKAIAIVYEKLYNSSLNILGYPERYRMTEDLMFNTPSHPNKQGAELRTLLLIEDILLALSDIE